MREDRPPARRSAQLRLAVSYAAFLVAAGAVVLAGAYVVLRYVPNYPLTAANPSESESGTGVASRQEILDALLRLSGVLLAGLALVGIIGGWLLAGWVLRPLRRIDEAARIAATGRLDHRIDLTGRNDEFRQLADTFDHMLDRLGAEFAARQRFAANASHELRTPLAVTATMLDVARRHPDAQDYPTLLERLALTNARAVGLTEALLDLADVGTTATDTDVVDLAAVVAEALAETAEEADALGLRIRSGLEPARAVGSRALLTQLVVNLVQNAVRHNVRGGELIVRTGGAVGNATGATLAIENDGDIFTAEETSRLHEPFLRGRGRVHESVRDEFGRPHRRGYGLGLALVARIAEVHEGDLRIRPRPGGGLLVTVHLPAAG
ncbi:sensor histidine kinase [Rhodococcus sp. SGAir0479]|uniref:sensor histidine kinase n=1 Tax=Rhodococcus sp. SGAir0479 TaxID=2567884 RepID=UPI0010CCC999|nr:HAMP domain-containing sensor histidine kinase [Rhodococcus sp. SGAir0479]QCQ89948.1 HAMP domain-containing histidine kinase [Rhodococcus sp. SGAir0479]